MFDMSIVIGCDYRSGTCKSASPHIRDALAAVRESELFESGTSLQLPKLMHMFEFRFKTVVQQLFGCANARRQ